MCYLFNRGIIFLLEFVGEGNHYGEGRYDLWWRMNSRPQRPQMDVEPQCVQMYVRPQCPQMNVEPQCMQMNARL